MMKIDFNVNETGVLEIEIPENIIMPSDEDLSVMPLVCGIVVGMILPFGMLVFMKQMLSCEVGLGLKGCFLSVNPICIVLILAILSSFSLLAWLIYVRWKTRRMEIGCKSRKQSMEFVASIVGMVQQRIIIPNGTKKIVVRVENETGGTVKTFEATCEMQPDNSLSSMTNQ